MSAAAVEPFWTEVPRDVLRVTGPDTVAFLQGQLSQDVKALAPGASAWTFVLQPQGKVDAWMRVTRTGDDEVLLDVDGGFGPAVAERLERFKLRTKATVETLDWRCLAVRGVAAAAADSGAAGEGTLALDAGWGPIAGFDLLGPAPVAPAGVAEGTAGDYEALRIECGVPAMGRELTARTIPAEAGVVERSVSFTKGCFTGQELVARIDSRGGKVPRRLRGLVLEGAGSLPEAGTAVLVGEDEVGEVTSAAWSTRRGGAVALAYVKRDVEPPAEVAVGGAGGAGGEIAHLHELPLLR
ncbi:MAG TPA: glycine cleavage T C-terminal barrel domain-containing protein [Acidimicrobiales bacterium]|nr:glycine cleavage T C-terminal barrel domain-containing protein [Acidimicrobiales bacterium]